MIKVALLLCSAAVCTENTVKTANLNSRINFYFVTCFYSLYDICNRRNANNKTNPQAYVITKKTVISKSVLKLNSVAGGGFAISILAQ